MPPRSRGPTLILAWKNLAREFREAPRTLRPCVPSRNACPRPSSDISVLTHTHHFTTTRLLQKKEKHKKGSSRASPSEAPSAESTAGGSPDPYDFSELDAGIAKALERLKDALVKTRNAGRVSVEMIEGLPVELKEDAPGGKATQQKVKLADVATVVPRGRMAQVHAQEESLIKPLTAAILASPYSLTPTPEATKPLVLNIPLPPATAETRAQAAAEAKKSLERANQEVRSARGDAQKQFRKMELGRLVTADELRKAHKRMEEAVKKGEGQAKGLCDAAVKGLER